MPNLRPIVVLACLTLPALANAGPPQLQLPAFTHLENEAVESVDINVGSFPLALARWFMDDEDEIESMLKGVRSVRVRHYRFATDFVYSKADVDSVRSQLSGTGWSPLAQVRNHKTQEDVDVFLALEKKIITRMAVVVSEPREFTIVDIVGKIDPEQIGRLRKQFAREADDDASPLEPSADL